MPASSPSPRALDCLEAADAELDAHGVVRRSMDPARPRARTLTEIGRSLAPRAAALPAATFAAWARGLARTALAIREHFPENLFWDLDYVGAALLRRPDELEASFDELTELHSQFGARTAIRFRYVHDFVYGFDWAKWVRREASERAGVGPFDLRFLRAVRGRGRELALLIAQDDAQYPRLSGGEARNPFTFSREPADELALHRDLGGRGLVPVRAWCFDAPPIWNRPFAEARTARAAALGLLK